MGKGVAQGEMFFENVSLRSSFHGRRTQKLPANHGERVHWHV